MKANDLIVDEWVTDQKMKIDTTEILYYYKIVNKDKDVITIDRYMFRYGRSIPAIISQKNVELSPMDFGNVEPLNNKSKKIFIKTVMDAKFV